MNHIPLSVHENLNRSDRLWLETLVSELWPDSNKSRSRALENITNSSTENLSNSGDFSGDSSGTPPSPDSQAQAIQKLTSRLIQYGPTDPIALPAARRLLPLIANPKLSFRAQICSLLEGLCQAASLAASPSTSPRSASERRLARDFLNLVSEHRATLFDALNDADLELRIAAPTLIAALPAIQPAIQPGIQQGIQDEGLEMVERRLAIETHRLVRASLIEAKSRLAWQCSAASLRNLAQELARCALQGSAAASSDPLPELSSPSPLLEHSGSANSSAPEAPITRIIAAVNLLVFEDYRPAAIQLILDLIESAEDDVLRLPWIQGESLLHFVRSGYDESPQLCLQWYQAFLDHPRYQSEALWGLADLALEWRAMAAPVAKLLVQAMSSASPELRKRARYDVTRVGRAAIPLLEPLLESPNAEIRLAAADALRDIESYQAEASQQANFQNDLEPALNHPSSKRARESEADEPSVFGSTGCELRLRAPRSLERLRDLKSRGSTWDRIDALKQIASDGPVIAECAENLGSDNLGASLEPIDEALSDPVSWVRLHAARTLWLLGGDFDRALLTVIGELRGRPSGFLALAILERMGPAAYHAERCLKNLIESPRRVMELGEFYRSAHLDEEFLDRCKACLKSITPKRGRNRTITSQSEKPPLKSLG